LGILEVMEPPTTLRRGVRRAGLTACGALLAATLALVTLSGAGAGATTRRHPPPARGPVVKVAHAAFDNCSASDVVMSVSVSQHSFKRGQQVRFTVSVHNVGKVACGYSSLSSQQPSSVQTMGPCGPIEFAIENAQGSNIWPGVVAYSCPMMLSTNLAPGQTLRAQGVWNQESWQQQNKPASLSREVPRGGYRVVIARAVTVRFALD
jgi:hypothetical protein